MVIHLFFLFIVRKYGSGKLILVFFLLSYTIFHPFLISIYSYFTLPQSVWLTYIAMENIQCILIEDYGVCVVFVIEPQLP